MIVVPRINTKISTKEAIEALVYGWNKTVNTCPDKSSIGILVAQWAFETGWGKFCWNYNLGNHRTYDGYLGKAIELASADEYINGKRVIVGGYFQAFDSKEEGGEAHVRLLSQNPRYKEGWKILNENPDPVLFVKAIKKAGYFTGDESVYARGVASITQSVIGLMQWDCEPKPLPEEVWDNVELVHSWIRETF